MKIQIFRNVLLTVLALCFVSIAEAQSLKTYSGDYPDNRNGSHTGKAVYTYYEDEMVCQNGFLAELHAKPLMAESTFLLYSGYHNHCLLSSLTSKK